MARSRYATRISELRKQNNALAAHVAVLEHGGHRKLTLSNNMTQLVQMFQQSNLTSLNPIIANNIYYPITLDWLTLTYMYSTHGILQTAIEVPVLDALRGGIEIKSAQLDAEDIKEILDFFEEHELFQAIAETMVWARLYGGAGLVVNVMDQDPAKPLKLRKSDADIQFYAANRWEFGMGYRAMDPATVSSMPPQAFNARTSERYDFYGKPVDRTHVFDVAGKAAPALLRWQLQGWGMSEMQRMIEDFNKYLKNNNVTYELLEEAKIDVFKMDGLNSALLTATGTANIFNRIQKSNALKNFHTGLILDKNDDYEQKQISFSGLADMTRETRIGLATALRMPFSKLYGTTAGGGSLANSGQDDLENYNAMVESEVREKLRPLIRKALRLVTMHLFGAELDIAFEFKPLRVLSGVEEENVKTSKQARITTLFSMGLLTSQEAMNELAKEKLVPHDTLAGQGLLQVTPPQQGGDQPEGGEEESEADDDE